MRHRAVDVIHSPQKHDDQVTIVSLLINPIIYNGLIAFYPAWAEGSISFVLRLDIPLDQRFHFESRSHLFQLKPLSEALLVDTDGYGDVMAARPLLGTGS